MAMAWRAGNREARSPLRARSAAAQLQEVLLWLTRTSRSRRPPPINCKPPSSREAAEIVALNPLLSAPIRDVSDIVAMQTAIIGEADFLCTRDRDFYA
jgi:hypothetical protein